MSVRTSCPRAAARRPYPRWWAKKVEKKKEVLLLAKDSPIIFERPEITDSKVVEDIQKESEKEYETTAAGTPGALGEGGGTEGGWPDGLPGGELRFIRIKHSGQDWDDGLTRHKGNADANFLTRLRKLPSIKFPVAANGEAHSASLLADYPKGYAPPFMYITGSGRVGISGKERSVLKKYLEEGGMLFADAGSPQFNTSFRSFAKSLWGKPLVTISDDDIIFKTPYNFPQGIDPLWHHGGRKAMGIKHDGRWVVFYHPGDVNDCWKDDAVRIPKRIRNNAFQVGYNVIYYAITRYLEATRKYRKK